MDLLDFCEIFDGCKTRATGKLSKTSQKSQINHAHCDVIRRCCCYLSNSSSVRNHKQENSNNIKALRRSRRSTEEGVGSSCSRNHSHRRSRSHRRSCNRSRDARRLKIHSSRERQLAALLLVAIAFTTLEQQQRVAAAAFRLTAAKSKSTEAEPASSSQELHPLHLNNHVAGLYEDNNNNNNNHNHYSTKRRTRLRKRHSNHLYFETHLHESSETLDPWQNPCGGSYYPMTEEGGGAGDDFSDGTHRRREALPLHYYLKPLRFSTRQEYRTLNEALHAIDIDDIQTWSLYKNHYKFLPNVKRNSSVTLKRWYRNMQIYVAAFAFLGRTQYDWDRSKLRHASETTNELNELLLSARRLLCELETVIKGSNPQGGRQHHNNALTAISRSDMNNRLRFRTTRHALHLTAEADTIDLKFAKYSYYNFLESMSKVMRENGKRRGLIVLQDPSSDDLRISEEEQEENADMSIRNRSMDSSSGSSSSDIESFENIESDMNEWYNIAEITRSTKRRIASTETI